MLNVNLFLEEEHVFESVREWSRITGRRYNLLDTITNVECIYYRDECHIKVHQCKEAENFKRYSTLTIPIGICFAPNKEQFVQDFFDNRQKFAEDNLARRAETLKKFQCPVVLGDFVQSLDHTTEILSFGKATVMEKDVDAVLVKNLYGQEIVWGHFSVSRGKFKGNLANNANTEEVVYNQF